MQQPLPSGNPANDLLKTFELVRFQASDNALNCPQQQLKKTFETYAQAVTGQLASLTTHGAKEAYLKEQLEELSRHADWVDLTQLLPLSQTGAEQHALALYRRFTGLLAQNVKPEAFPLPPAELEVLLCYIVKDMYMVVWHFLQAKLAHLRSGGLRANGAAGSSAA